MSSVIVARCVHNSLLSVLCISCLVSVYRTQMVQVENGLYFHWRGVFGFSFWDVGRPRPYTKCDRMAFNKWSFFKAVVVGFYPEKREQHQQVHRRNAADVFVEKYNYANKQSAYNSVITSLCEMIFVYCTRCTVHNDLLSSPSSLVAVGREHSTDLLLLLLLISVLFVIIFYCYLFIFFIAFYRHKIRNKIIIILCQTDENSYLREQSFKTNRTLTNR